MSESDFVVLAKTSEISENRTTCFNIDGVAVVAAQVEGEYYAVHNKCSHAEQSFDKGRVRGHKLLCPLHGAIFDIRDGAVLGAPAFNPIKSYPLKVEGDDVLINLQES